MARSGFDVVVVGGGAAGCVVAGRLASNAARSVLLLEAGPDRRANLPGKLRDGWSLARGADWEHDWKYVAEPDARGIAEELRRGRLLGGTSWLTRFAVRGSPADFDGWEALGCPGWGFDQVLPYFNRLETDLDFGDEEWHGGRGPMPITRYREHAPTDIHAAVLDALSASGFPTVDDLNQPGAVGIGRIPMSSREGVRVTTMDAYLPPGGTPSNLTVRCDALVAEVVLEGSRARGVRLADGNVIRADRVVLSAGTYGSASALMRSGIGPAGHLTSVGIPVRVDLRGVGANLADHVGVDLSPGWRGTSRTSPVLQTLATFHSAAADPRSGPDLMFWVADPAGDPPGFSMDPVLLRPHSRGVVRLRSADPTDSPRVELPGLRESSDPERLAEGYRRGVEIANRPEVRRLCADPPPPELGPDELRRAVRENSYSIPHVVGTCAMGSSPGDGAVVDTHGSVFGTEGLSVVDASIIPDSPSGFPHLITIMIAERLSEQI